MRRVLPALLFLLGLLAACTGSPAPSLDKRLDTLARQGVLFPSAAPGAWTIDGGEEVVLQAISIGERNSYPALRVAGGEAPFAFVRETHTRLQLAPFLTWAWNMDPHGEQGHPIHIIVGFRGGNPIDTRAAERKSGWLGLDLPPHDRLLAVTWEGSALRRGELRWVKSSDPRIPARHSVRGGREHAGLWWRETTDLTGVYRLAWPGDDINQVRVVFMGIASAGGSPGTAGHVSGIMLSR